MGKKGKVGKSRRDKFYHLAKETGYRSRAAFKLIQLNRKFEFLQKSNVIVDLCAAPGGWLQVVAENAPMSNLVIGIDLDPINPVKNCKTLQEDITTEKCRQALKKELHNAKADLFLNDGAPNVGKNWIHDAYLQAELTLYALKLATEFLRKGGWFVTKVFRSKDYDSLLWVFQQLFKNVHATKPQASRNESAEIFVVCENYIAPDKIDPKFLNPKFAFSDVSTEKKMAIDLIHPAKKRRNREGYPEGDYTLFHSLPVTQFLASSDFMDLLAESSEIKLDSEEVANHPLTTTEIKECIKDIKLLGKKEIKSVFTWRKKLNAFFEAASGKEEGKESGEQKDEEMEGVREGVDQEDADLIQEEKEIAQMEKMLEEKNLLELKTMKKAKKKVKQAQAKQKARIDLKMAIPGDQIDIQGDTSMFNIKTISSRMMLSKVETGETGEEEAGDIFEEDNDEEKLVPKKASYDKENRKYVGAGEDTDEEDDMEEEPTFDDDVYIGNEDESDNNNEDENSKKQNPLLADFGTKERIMKDNEDSWFNKAVFAGLEKDRDEDVELGQMGLEEELGQTSKKKRAEAKALVNGNAEEDSDEAESSSDDDDVDDDDDEEEDDNDSGESESDSRKIDSGFDDEEEDDDEEDDEDDSDSDSDDDGDEEGYMGTTVVKRGKKRAADSDPSAGEKEKKVTKFDGIEVVPAVADLQLDEEGLAIGAAMVQSRKRRREIIDASYHKYMFDDVDLPDWFAEDDKKHSVRHRPVSKQEVEEYKMKSKAIDAQPIRKVAEAKARKKKRMLKSLEKARKKANAISDNVDVSEKEKWNQIKTVYKKAGLLNKAKEKVTYVKAKKGAGKKVRRPAGVKGKFKVVDGRMKKDTKGQMKAEMRKQKTSKSAQRHKQMMSKGKRRVRR